MKTELVCIHACVCIEPWHYCYQKFDNYPDTLADIDEKMHEFQVKADLCAGIDPRVRHSMLHWYSVWYNLLCAGLFAFIVCVCVCVQVVHEYKSREKEIDQLGREVRMH